MRLTRRGRTVAALLIVAALAAMAAAADPAGPCDAAPSTLTECHPPLAPIDY